MSLGPAYYFWPRDIITIIIANKRRGSITMKVAGVLLFILFAVQTTAVSRSGDYKRSAISSVESVWIKPGANIDMPLDFEFFESMMGLYVEMPRFDYNELPDAVVDRFRNRVSRMNVIDEQDLAELLQETVGEAILDILNDPEIMKSRGLALRDESAWQTFAATRARSVGLTVEELELLMNSSYVYLPYVSSITVSLSRAEAGSSPGRSFLRALQSDDQSAETQRSSTTAYNSVRIEGGIIWFSVNICPDGEVSISELLNVTAGAGGRAERGREHTFRVGNDTWEVNSRTYALYEATQNWVRQLGVETRGIPEFQLRGSIVEVLSGRNYSLALGREEGVYLDDMYELVELRRESDGTESAATVGYARITDVGDNTADPLNYSTASQLLGRRQGVGIIAREYPRIGYDLRITMGISDGLLIPASEIGWLLSDVTRTYDLNLSYAYNLAPVTGISQSFLSIDIGLGFPVDYDRAPAFDDGSLLLLDFYLGYTKKFWFAGRNNIGLRFGAGLDAMRMSAGDDNSLTLFSAGGRASLDYELLLGPAWSFSIGAGYKMATRPLQASMEVDGESGEFLVEESEIDLGGVFFTAGITYSIRNTGLNLFGFLDGFRSN
ncbi:hypothetical protein QA596_06640 [Balneolales bacterium ANBcel1]|nr:hypothetical protein [Balneolales bacterium ANBcel1]